MNLLHLFSPRKWASKILKPRPQRKVNPRRLFVHPRLEVLEDRTLLTAYLVDLATDNNAGGGGQQDPNNANAGDLRYCLTQANKGAGNTITFSTLTNKNQVYTIDLSAALPTVSQSMTIAPGAGISATVERSATAATDFRIINIGAGDTVSLGAFVIQNGLLQANEGDGGGIYNGGTLTLNRTVIRNNKTAADGGGIYNAGNLTLNGGSIGGNSAANGAGIFNFGTISTQAGAPVFSFGGNQASNNGGAIYNCTFRDFLTVGPDRLIRGGDS